MSHTQNEHAQPVGPALPGWTARARPRHTTLTGRFCRLEPLDAARHAADLHDAYVQAGDARDWTYMAVGPFADLDSYRRHAEAAAASTDPLHFAVVDAQTGHAIGTLALMRIDPAHGVVEVGHVMFSPALKQTPISTEAQFLLMQYVFDHLGYRRYEWKCDSLNAPSRKTAARLGFQFEGVFRQAVVYKGRSRDTAWFSIVDGDWPAVRAAFVQWLAPDNFDMHGAQRRTLAGIRSAPAQAERAQVEIRPLAPGEQAAWLPLWRGYQQFYRVELSDAVTAQTWERLMDPAEPMHVLGAFDTQGQLLGIVHFIVHRSTWTVGHYVYLQDLFTAGQARGQGVGRRLIEAVYARAREAGASRVHWLTHESNAAGRRLYDQVAENAGFIQYRKSMA
ncbi:GNAT family N-acetyltransferase [Pseudorhodoferax sp. Leaf267]|uniref:GNAT family N-acetyltransferase n=1 Tax=Pseudorhodoferax sp. Leaf267 TaxID=1736316 RepID=UPI0006F6B79C|nr:GNAT family N-acetyltransferase [Pseudorhodoferax sp. Leaf267]KQP21679.1 GCN5 family acetyltransferase [Pseudorhodoferax sp. Leaf267]